MAIFGLFELLFFTAQKGVLSFQNIIKDIFLAYIAKTKVGKITIFGPKPWVNPFEIMSIFRLFELFVFIVQKGVFSFQNIIKKFFWPILPQKKKLEKWAFLEQNDGLTPLEKCQFFDFLKFLFLQPKKAFFCYRLS